MYLFSFSYLRFWIWNLESPPIFSVLDCWVSGRGGGVSGHRDRSSPSGRWGNRSPAVWHRAQWGPGDQVPDRQSSWGPGYAWLHGTWCTGYGRDAALWGDVWHSDTTRWIYHFPDDIVNHISLNENVWISIKIHLSLFLRVQLIISQHWFR